jgi:hypothetical protein
MNLIVEIESTNSLNRVILANLLTEIKWLFLRELKLFFFS